MLHNECFTLAPLLMPLPNQVYTLHNKIDDSTPLLLHLLFSGACAPKQGQAAAAALLQQQRQRQQKQDQGVEASPQLQQQQQQQQDIGEEGGAGWRDGVKQRQQQQQLDRADGEAAAQSLGEFVLKGSAASAEVCVCVCGCVCVCVCVCVCWRVDTHVHLDSFCSFDFVCALVPAYVHEK